jgi:hypothetical protein
VSPKDTTRRRARALPERLRCWWLQPRRRRQRRRQNSAHLHRPTPPALRQLIPPTRPQKWYKLATAHSGQHYKHGAQRCQQRTHRRHGQFRGGTVIHLPSVDVSEGLGGLRHAAGLCWCWLRCGRWQPCLLCGTRAFSSAEGRVRRAKSLPARRQAEPGPAVRTLAPSLALPAGLGALPGSVKTSSRSPAIGPLHRYGPIAGPVQARRYGQLRRLLIALRRPCGLQFVAVSWGSSPHQPASQPASRDWAFLRPASQKPFLLWLLGS